MICTRRGGPGHLFDVFFYIWYYRSVGDVNEFLKQRLFSKEQDGNDRIVHIWNEVLESPMFQNKPLLPNEECIIDFSTLELGTRVGIGKTWIWICYHFEIKQNSLLNFVGLYYLQGCFAEVFRGTWNETEVAVKIFTDQGVTVENIKDFCNEIFILRYFISF